MDEAKNGEDICMESLCLDGVEGYRDYVVGVARFFVHRHDMAEDVAQLVFIRLSKKLEKLPSGASFRSWLYVNTRSLSIDLLRSEAARRRREQAYVSSLESGTPDFVWIEEALTSLIQVDRELIVERFYAKRSYKELAQTRSITEDAARMRVKRVLDQLRSSPGASKTGLGFARSPADGGPAAEGVESGAGAAPGGSFLRQGFDGCTNASRSRCGDGVPVLPERQIAGRTVAAASGADSASFAGQPSGGPGSARREINSTPH